VRQDLFFEFPWNNFLHSVVYDLVHQILNGKVESEVNRDLIIALFRDARLMHRIVNGQKVNDEEKYVILQPMSQSLIRSSFAAQNPKVSA
jgi:serine/threonine-protein phosphatase 6 regulatory subunit 3